MASEPKYSIKLPLHGEFVRIANDAAEAAQRRRVLVKAFKDPKLPYYSQIDYLAKARACREIANWKSSLDELDHDIFSAELKNLWKTFSVLGLVPPPNLLALLQPGMATEIYDVNCRQIWRNLTCMEMCSYSLEEVDCLDVFDRYQRMPFIEKLCETQVVRLLSGDSPDVFDPKIPPHYVFETMSEGGLLLEVHHRIFSVLRNRAGSIAAWLVMSDARLEARNARSTRPDAFGPRFLKI